METTIVDTETTARQKLSLLNKRQTLFIRYFSLVPLIFGPILLLTGLTSSYTFHSSMNGTSTYTNLNLGIGLGIALILTAIYLELQLFRIRGKLHLFSFSETTYSFTESGIKTTSEACECAVKWSAVKQIVPVKNGYLISTNNYSCPTIFLLNSQISASEIDWIASQIRKKQNHG